MTRQDVSLAAARLLLVAALAYLYGRLIALVPSPDDPTQFWVANLAAPFCVAPLVAGALSRRGATAAVAGGSTATAMVAGFYRFDAVGLSSDAAQRDLPLDTPRLQVALDAYRDWFHVLVLGNLPWLTIAAVVGVAAGLAGWACRRLPRVLSVALGAPFVAEGLVLALAPRVLVGPDARSFPNLTIWTVEILVGIVLTAALLRRATHPRDRLVSRHRGRAAS